MPRGMAERELLASRDQVWGFLAEPLHLADWWPGIAAVRPDRRGLAPGARWQVQRSDRPTLLRRPGSSELLLVRVVEPPDHLAWNLSDERIDVDLRLRAEGPSRTLATLAVEGRWLFGPRRSLPREALDRLHALCQYAADAAG
jgi:hypothetical protein